jgi:glycosyltransferase involved in cell wall biosynthesis
LSAPDRLLTHPQLEYMRKKILFISDWPDSFKNGAVLQKLLDKDFSDNYEWTIWSCKKKIDSDKKYRWKCYFKGAFYAISNRKKYDAIFMDQQMIAYIIFEIRKYIPVKLPAIVFTSIIYNSNTIFQKYRKYMVRNALKYCKAIIWPSAEMAEEVTKDFPIYSYKNHFAIPPIFDVTDDPFEVNKQLDDPFFRNGVYAAGSTERDFNVVVKAFKTTSIPVTIVCTDDYRITETDIPPTIRVLRFSQVPHDQYYALAKQAFCIVNSVASEKSTAGMLLLHFAINHSKPIISSKSDGIKDFIIDNETGLLFQIGHSEEILQAYQKLKKDKVFAENIANKAKEVARQISPEYFIPKLLSIIENN